MGASRFRVVPMTIDERGSGERAVAYVRHADTEDDVGFWAVQQREEGRWYTVDDFQSMEEAKEFLRQLIESEGEE